MGTASGVVNKISAVAITLVQSWHITRSMLRFDFLFIQVVRSKRAEIIEKYKQLQRGEQSSGCKNQKCAKKKLIKVSTYHVHFSCAKMTLIYVKSH